MSDLCASSFCQDVALPGHDLCAGCLTDRQAERAEADERAARLTAEFEERVHAGEQAAA